ncbi:MAG: addiction module antitoxin [Thermoanaerobaculia bacterium]
MTKKLTITIDDEVYKGLYRRVGPRRISRFLEALARPHVIDEDLEAEYAAMAADEVREAEAVEWTDNLVGDALDETS